MNTPTETRSTPLLSSLHARLTVLQAGADERARLAEALAYSLGLEGYYGATTRGTAEFFDAAREVALRRIEEHERIRGELTAQLRKARDVQAGATNRRDEAAARVRRMATHLTDSEALLERSAELRAAAGEVVAAPRRP